MKEQTDGRKWKSRDIGGYTLVELIVVIVILMTVSGGLILGVSGWARRAEFSRQNSSARMIFSAMQNQLTRYSQNGRLPELLDAVVQDGSRCVYPRAVEELTNADGTPYTADEVWIHSGGDRRYQSELASVVLTPEDYQAYRAGSGSGISAAVYDMLKDYLYDDTVLEANIGIDFTPAEGQVFAVLYSDCGGNVNIADRSQKNRFHTVGYYGVDTLSAKPEIVSDGQPTEKPEENAPDGQPTAELTTSEKAGDGSGGQSLEQEEGTVRHEE